MNDVRHWGPFVLHGTPDVVTLGVVLVVPFTGRKVSVQLLFVRAR